MSIFVSSQRTSMVEPALRTSDMAPFASWKRAIDDGLSALVPRGGAAPAVLTEAWSHAALAPGKRLRALLVFSVLQDLGMCAEDHLYAGCAVEMVHTASLILDDLPCMDNASLRRGRPTLHRAYGESVAILTAVALLNAAYGLCAQAEGGRLVDILVKAVGAGGLIAGQLGDLQPQSRDMADIESTYAKKTGALFVASCEMAADLAEADASTRGALHAFATSTGLAFQILDDVLDATAEADQIGKDVQQDRNVTTVASASNLLYAQRRRDAALNDARAHLDKIADARAVSQWLAAAFQD